MSFFKKFFKGIEKRALRPVFKNAAPLIGSAAGMFFGGPAGAIAGGALGGSTQRGSGNKFRGMARGAAMGAAYSALAPMAGEALGVSPTGTGFFPSVTGLNQPSLLNQLGMSSAPGIGGGLGLYGNAGIPGVLEGGGLLGKAASFAPKLLGLAGKASGAGALNAHEFPYSQEYEDRSFHGGVNPELMHGAGLSQKGKGALHYYQHMDPKTSYSMPGHDLMSGALLGQLSEKNKKKKSLHEEYMAQLAQPLHTTPIRSARNLAPVERRYAKGGHARGKYVNHNTVGYIKEGDTGGQDDDVDMRIPSGAYVMNATDLSLYGDGSSENGAKKIAQFEHRTLSAPRKRTLHDKMFDFDRGGYTRPYDEHTMNVKVSNDEYVLRPETVARIGGGSNDRGAKILDKARMQLRRQKGVKKILPPKSKGFDYYLKAGGR